MEHLLVIPKNHKRRSTVRLVILVALAVLTVAASGGLLSVP